MSIINNDSDITQSLLKTYFYYDPDTGIFLNLVARGRVKIGTVAGSLLKDGYWKIGLFGKGYKAHRLAWLYVYGSFPEGILDHINQIKTDNRISNLREVSIRDNGSNRKDNSKIVGVYKARNNSGRYTSQIQINGKIKYLGTFDTELEAKAAYDNEKDKLNE